MLHSYNKVVKLGIVLNSDRQVTVQCVTKNIVFLIDIHVFTHYYPFSHPL